MSCLRCLFVVRTLPRCGLHLSYVIGEIDDHLNRLFVWMFIIKVVDILLDLKTVISDRLSALAERLFQKGARCRVDISPKAQLLALDPGSD